MLYGYLSGLRDCASGDCWYGVPGCDYGRGCGGRSVGCRAVVAGLLEVLETEEEQMQPVLDSEEEMAQTTLRHPRSEHLDGLEMHRGGPRRSQRQRDRGHALSRVRSAQ